MKRPIAISLSPNAQKDDVLLAAKLLVQPINWFNFRKTERLETEFAKMFGKSYKAIAVNSGRSALYLILKALGAETNTEIAMQALTCVAVPNAVLWLGGRPLYIDVDNSFNLDVKDLKKKISKNTKAVIIQHAFGVPANIDSIKRIAKQKKIILIEDCALSLGAKYKNKQVGTFGDAAFFSFGRDKVISSVFGGMILCKDKKLYEKLLIERDRLDYPGPVWLIKQLLHPILFSMILPFYNTGFGKLTIGKVVLFFLQLTRILSKPVYKEEKVGLQPKHFPRKMPGALSDLALNQLQKLEKFNGNRFKITNYYFEKLKKSDFILPRKAKGAVWMRFPVVYSQVEKILRCAKKSGILLGDWYASPVVPVNNLSLVDYKEGSCPNAEKISGRILNLPTYPNMGISEARKVVSTILRCQKS